MQLRLMAKLELAEGAEMPLNARGAWRVARLALCGLASAVASHGLHAQPQIAGKAAPTPAAIISPAPQAGMIEWSSLSARQREALQPLANDWQFLERSSQDKWLALANRFPAMNAEERIRVQARMTQWARMSAAERGKARLRFQRAKQISPQEKQAQWNAYQSLPEEQRRQLAEKALAKQHAAAASRDKKRTPESDGSPKSNLVTPPRRGETPLKPVAPTVVQAQPGATTTLISKRPTPAPHLKPGLPKVAATPSLVDSTTLLPKQGPQGVTPPGAAASAAQPGSPSKPARHP